jgi:hypothetical protein
MTLLFNKLTIPFYLFIILISCGSNSNSNNELVIEPPFENSDFAEIVSVATSGNENAYTFSVGIQSPDEGCNQYANWWEVLSEDGELIYRRILGHSHVNEQPFVRSGGTVNISEDQVVIVRAHMNTSSYGTFTFKGSVSEGFVLFETAQNFATELETQNPLPKGCAF